MDAKLFPSSVHVSTNIYDFNQTSFTLVTLNFTPEYGPVKVEVDIPYSLSWDRAPVEHKSNFDDKVSVKVPVFPLFPNASVNAAL